VKGGEGGVDRAWKVLCITAKIGGSLRDLPRHESMGGGPSGGGVVVNTLSTTKKKIGKL